MTNFENEDWSRRVPKKHFYAVPEGIGSFTDAQIDEFAEKLYDQMVRDMGIEVTEPTTEESQQRGETVSTKLPPKMKLSSRFFEAVEYATKWHEDQVRKSTDIPYICHPLGAASLVIESGGDEDQAIGALLHDIAEDCGGEPRLAEIKQMFGDRVEAIVRGCSDSLTESEEEKASWKSRKDAHLSHLRGATHDVLIVTAADKVHNARAIATDLLCTGPDVWKRFNKETTPQLIIGYYEEMLSILRAGGVTDQLLKPLESAIEVMKGDHPLPLAK